MFESRRELTLAGAALTLVAAAGSFVAYLAAKQQCSGEAQGLVDAIANRNSVCKALGLPLAPGTGSHLFLIAILVVTPVVATLGTIAAVDSGSSRPLTIASVFCAVAGLGLIILVGNATSSSGPGL